jgi:hypothetical protein
MKQIPYKEAVGALLYLSNTMSPGTSYAVGQVAKYSKNPGIQHWKAVKRIFRYKIANLRDSLLSKEKRNGDGLHGC